MSSTQAAHLKHTSNNIFSCNFLLLLPAHLASPSGDGPHTPGREGRGQRAGEGGSSSLSHHHRLRSGSLGILARRRGGSLGEGRGGSAGERDRDGNRSQAFSFQEESNAPGPARVGSGDPLHALSLAALCSSDKEVELEERAALAAGRLPKSRQAGSPQRTSRKQHPQQQQQQSHLMQAGRSSSSDYQGKSEDARRAGGGAGQGQGLGPERGSGQGLGSGRGRDQGPGSFSPDRRSNPGSPSATPR